MREVLWFFICFRRPYAPCLYISPPGWLDSISVGHGALGAKVFPKNSIAVSALSGCILAAYARKHDCLSCKKGLCCPSSTTFCVGQTVVSTERLTGRYARRKRERVSGKDFSPDGGTPPYHYDTTNGKREPGRGLTPFRGL